MPKFRVTAPDGVASVIEGENQADAIAKGKAQREQASTIAPIAAPEKPVPSPVKDVVGRAKEWLTREPPKSPYEADWETFTPGRVARAAGDMFLPESIPQAAATAATLPFGGPAVTGPARLAMGPARRFASNLFSGNVLTAPLKRMTAAGLAGGGARLAQGADLKSAAKEGLYQAGTQGVGEVLPGAARFGLEQKAGKRLLGERAAAIGQREIGEGAAVKVRQDKITHDTEMEKALSLLEKGNYEGAVAARRSAESARIREARAQHQERVRDANRDFKTREEGRQAQHRAAIKAEEAHHAATTRAYEQSGAQIIADGFKEQVPALRDFPSNEKGLLGMVSGEGPQRVSARFDAALNDVVATGKGKPVEVAASDAKALGLKMKGLRQMDKTQEPTADVDGGQLAKALLGFWKTDHGVYRRGVGALDQAGIGNPTSRAEYRAAQALFDFAEDSQMLAGKKFNPDAARAAFDHVKKLDQLRKRGQGDMFTGPVAEAVNRPAPELHLPAEPTPGTPPASPAFRRPAASPEIPQPARRAVLEPPEVPSRPPLSPTPEGVTTRTIPKMGFFTGAAIAELPFMIGAIASGQHTAGGYGYGLPVAVGGLLSSAVGGRRVITRAPLSPAARFATDVLPTTEAQQVRKRVPEPMGPSAEPPKKTPGRGASLFSVGRAEGAEREGGGEGGYKRPDEPFRTPEGTNYTTYYPLRGENFNVAKDPTRDTAEFMRGARNITLGPAQTWPDRNAVNEYAREGLRGRSMSERDMRTLTGDNPGWTPGPTGEAQTLMDLIRELMGREK